MKPCATMLRRLFEFAIILVVAAAITDRDVGAASDGSVTPAKLKAQYKRPDSIPFPANNPYSDVKAQLGQTLFFDPRLSGPATMSCASCHNPALGWKDGLPRGVGNRANQLGRATPTLLNLAWADLLMWDGRKDGLEDQASGPIEADAEMNLPMPKLIERLSDIPSYRRMFHEAFGRDEISKTTITRAIATFERTLVSNKAPFDRWIEGDEHAISAAAKHGFQIFNEKGHCAACHSGWRFTDDSFHDIGLKSEDVGRGGQVPNEPMLKYAFKTPTLRNVDQRAPYMHDGSMGTLRDVIVHYDSGFVERPSLSSEMHRLALTEQEIDDLVAFLHTLTSQDDPISVPVLPTKEEG
jgi:cytochrome c peroxidase